MWCTPAAGATWKRSTARTKPQRERRRARVYNPMVVRLLPTLLAVAASCTGSIGAPRGDPVAGGAGDADSRAGDASTGDTTAGDRTGGDRTAGDATAGDASAGDSGTVACAGSCVYIRDGAGGDGSDWANALDDLPGTLERDTVYLVADGAYAGGTLSAGAGTSPVTIVKATAASHGTEIGWHPGLGDGTALFAALIIEATHLTLDGGPARGIEVRAGYQGSVVDIAADHVTVRSVDINGNFASAGNHTGGACTGLSIGADHVTVSHCDIHDAADDGVSASGVRFLLFEHNRVHDLHGCGTDGGCGPCYNGHSDGLEIYNVKDSQFLGNFVYDMASTSAFFFGNWADSLGGGPSEYCERLLLANNIFYSPDTGFVAYIQDVDTIDVFHNVFWGERAGRYGGLSLGEHVTGLRMFNNIILSINLEHVGAAYDPSEHVADHNLIGVGLGQFPLQSNDVENSDPGFVNIHAMTGPGVTDPSANDFDLQTNPPSPAIGAGHDGTGLDLPLNDFAGRARDQQPDLGAFEAP